MTPLEEYFNEFVRMPDYDLKNDLNRVMLFREGGLVRFVPKFPDGGFARFFNVESQGLPSVAIPQIQRPQYDTVQHINAMTNAAGTFAQTRQNQERLKMQKEEFEYQKEVNALNLEFRKEELGFRKQQFEHQKFIDDFTMMNTIQDSLTNISWLAEDDAKVREIYSKSGIGDLYSLATSGDNPDAMSQLQGAYQKLMFNPVIIDAQAKKKRFDSLQETVKGLDPVLVQSFSNYGEIVAAKARGESGPEFTITPEQMTQYKEYKNNLRQAGLAEAETQVELNKANAEKARAAGYEARVDAEIAEEDYDDYKAEVARINAGDGTEEEKRELIRQARASYKGKSTTRGAGTIQANTMGGRMQWYQSQGKTLEEARRLALEDERIANSNYMSYNGLGDPADPASGGGGATNKFTEDILKSTGGIGNWGPMPSAQRQTMEEVIRDGVGNLYFHSPESQQNGFDDPVRIEAVDKFEPSRIFIGPDGTTSVIGTVTTTDEKIAKKLNGGKTPRGRETQDGEVYMISGVMVKAPNGYLGIDIRQPRQGASASNETRQVGDRVVPTNIEFKSDSSATHFTQETLNKIGTLPYKVKLSEGAHHDNPNNFDIGLGTSYEDNKDAFHYIASPQGQRWAIENGFEVLYETPNKEEYDTEPKTWHAAMESHYNPKATATHLHIQRYDKTIYYHDDNNKSYRVRARFDGKNYIVEIPGSDPDVLTPDEYNFFLEDGTMYEAIND